MNNNKQIIKTIVFGGLLSALGIILNLIQIPYIIPYLKFDLSEVVVLIGMMISFTTGILVAIVKFILFFFLNPIDPIGNIALVLGSLIIGVSFYFLHKMLKLNLIVTLVLVTIIFSLAMTIANYYVITPAYQGKTLTELKNSQNYFSFIVITYLPYNILKMTFISISFYFTNKLVLKKIGL